MIDTCICPDCETELEVGGLYGHNRKCSECGCRIDVFYDRSIRVDVDTPFWSGLIWITMPEEE